MPNRQEAPYLQRVNRVEIKRFGVTPAVITPAFISVMAPGSTLTALILESGEELPEGWKRELSPIWRSTIAFDADAGSKIIGLTSKIELHDFKPSTSLSDADYAGHLVEGENGYLVQRIHAKTRRINDVFARTSFHAHEDREIFHPFYGKAVLVLKGQNGGNEFVPLGSWNGYKSYIVPAGVAHMLVVLDGVFGNFIETTEAIVKGQLSGTGNGHKSIVGKLEDVVPELLTAYGTGRVEHFFSTTSSGTQRTHGPSAMG